MARRAARTNRTTTATADLLIVGRIATGDPAAPRAEAMAVRDGRILAVGSAADLDGLTGPATKILSPDGVVIPASSNRMRTSGCRC
jgi:predicted amidohydrolase YtcJ